ncbi:calponin homology domain-containing protein DDB_G0272472 [Teleopsis dalmanni]|uniref:calponin homology domain-containing protein DDB_G0272472 n=1 Tax=Teleopsis dalmanni TaxID=139649 RepID=UPI0018CE080E|nr:calponin homology domain-containing protein DDB_G0272472 [Teleopsis dalmanni]XP_037958437.1 calponin homology domain-containing protein DDB_G0272472 [Teleopsis dalmanni]XP_037958438.1 calponin homology domain-containing protein DDB_G0272472 [Teleopsis dalmanni]
MQCVSNDGHKTKNLVLYQICDEVPVQGFIYQIPQIQPVQQVSQVQQLQQVAQIPQVTQAPSVTTVQSASSVQQSSHFVTNIQASSTNLQTSYHKPPVAPAKSPNLQISSTSKKSFSPIRKTNKHNSGLRVRSASTGRDKKSELQARYWALLFGNLQRAVNEIYQTVECYENISSCQEAILVLENYVRDFKALSEWFKVSWDYESKPLQQRPQSLAWEVRKSNPVPRVRAKSLSSPNASGHSSPGLSHCSLGKTSPCCGNNAASPQKGFRAYDAVPKNAMRVNVRELFSSSRKPMDEYTENDQHYINYSDGSHVIHPQYENHIELERKQDLVDTPQLCNQYSQTELEDDHLTLVDILEKIRLAKEKENGENNEVTSFNSTPNSLSTEADLNMISTDISENQFQDITSHNQDAQIYCSQIAANQEPKYFEIENNENRTSEINPAVNTTTLASTHYESDAYESTTTKSAASITNDSNIHLECKIKTSVDKNSNALNCSISNVTAASQKEPTALELTIQKMNEMENKVLMKDSQKNPTPPNAVLKQVEPVAKLDNSLKSSTIAKVEPTSKAPTNAKVESIAKVEQTIKTVSSLDGQKNVKTLAATSPIKYSSVLNRSVTPLQRNSPRTPVRASVTTSSVNKSKIINKTSTTTVTKRPGFSVVNNIAQPQRNSARYSNNLPQRVLTKSNANVLQTNSSNQLSVRSRTMLDINTDKTNPKALRNSTSSVQRSSHEDIESSTSTLKASNELISSSRGSLVQGSKINDRRSEPKQLPSEANGGWLTVKNRRRSSMHWSNRFNQPTGYASLPTLALLNEKSGSEERQQKPKKTNTAASTAILASTKKQSNAQKQASDTSSTAITKSLEKKHSNAQTPVSTNVAMTASEKKQPTAQKLAGSSNRQTKQLKTQKVTEKVKPNLRSDKKSSKTKGSIPAVQQKQLPAQSQKLTNPVQIVKSNYLPSIRPAIIKRQKSDLTGLKMTSLHKEYMRSEKNAQRKQSDQTTASEEERFSDINAKHGSTEKNGKKGNSDAQNKIDIKIQTNCDFSKTIVDLYESISPISKLEPKLPNNENNSDALSSCDEHDETLTNDLEFDEEHQRKLVEEQESLERQIRELENSEIDVDTETDETDCEVVLDNEHDSDDAEAMINTALDDVFSVNNESESDANLSLEMRYHALLSDMSWGEREETLATLQAYVSRHPGRAQLLHQKLSSPSRRRSLQETLKKYQAKQARAQQKRELLQKEKAVKIQQLLTRVEGVKAAKQQLIENRRAKMEDRLQRAAENREQFLRQIVEKAHDEEKKLKEINFIKNIEAQNKRLDLIESSKETEGRLQDLEHERQKRLEEKAAKEAAAERRRQEMEKERQRKVEKINESRLEKEQRIGKRQELKELQRQALAREKRRDREERLLALQAQQQQSIEELQRKILQKQQEYARRHEENIEHIRQRALELSIPTRNVDDNERTEDGGAAGGDECEISSTISDNGSREQSRAFRKKLNKIKNRLQTATESYFKELEPLPANIKRTSEIPKFLNVIIKGGGNPGYERPLGQIIRLLQKAAINDFQCFYLLDGLGTISSLVITAGMQPNSGISRKATVLAVQLYRDACTNCPQIARHAILGNTILQIFDALNKSLQTSDSRVPPLPVDIATELTLVCTVVLSSTYIKKSCHPKVVERLPDLLSYAVMIGLIDVLSQHCLSIQGPISEDANLMLSTLATVGLLTRFVDICPNVSGSYDASRFLQTIKSTQIFGAISCLYVNIATAGDDVTVKMISLAATSFNLFISLAVLDPATYQEILQCEKMKCQLLDCIDILLRHCVNNYPEGANANSDGKAVIIDIIAAIGFFSLNNKKNQDTLVFDKYKDIVINLTKLPHEMDVVVLPCFTVLIHKHNKMRNLLAKTFDIEQVDAYRKSDKAKTSHLVARLK